MRPTARSLPTSGLNNCVLAMVLATAGDEMMSPVLRSSGPCYPHDAHIRGVTVSRNRAI